MIYAHIEVLNQDTARQSEFANRKLFDRVDQGRKSLNAHFQAIPRFNRADAARGPGHNDVTWQQRHVGGNETDQLVAIKNQLAGVRVLAQLSILKKLNRQIMRVDLGFDVRSERRERVERFAPRPLALRL